MNARHSNYLRRLRLTKLGICIAAALVIATHASAQQAAPAEKAGKTSVADATTLDSVAVVGIRPSLAKAAQVKRNAPQVLDAISAEDIGKLPDDNVAEALQRVTGVQITRVFGEGQSVSIRGLPQVRVEVDGRTLLGWSARLSPPENEQLGRNSGLDTVPSGLFGRLEVRKSPLATQVEGGLGGSVNLVTPDPLDYKDTVLFGRAQAIYADGVEKFEPAFSGLIASQYLNNRLGFLLAVDATTRTTTTQAFERNNFFTTANRDLNADGVSDVSGDRLHYEQFVTNRSRTGATLEAEFQMTEQLNLKAEVIYSELKTEREQDFLAWRYAGQVVTNPTFENNFIVAGSSRGSLQQAGLYRAEPTESLLGALSAQWVGEKLTADFEVSYSEGTIDQIIRQITLDSINRTVPGTFDYRAGNVPSLDLGSFNPADPANYRASQVRANRLVGDLAEHVARMDFRYDLDAGALTSLYAGFRARELTSTSVATRSQLTPTAAEIVPYLTTTNGIGFLPDISGNFPRTFLTTIADQRFILDRVGGYPLQPNAARDYDLDEQSTAAYFMAEFDGAVRTVPYRANVGFRFVDTDFNVDSFLQVANQVALIPVNDQNSYKNFLPSGNIVFYATPDFLVRFAVSKTMQQAGIRELAPSIFVNQTNRSATGGNALLKPTEAKQADASFEYYFSKDGLASFSIFYKDVSDFIAQETILQEFPGFEALGPIPYTRPANIGSAKVRGFEIGYQVFFDRLPAPFDGLGLIANYTYSDAEDNLGNPLVGVSKNSFNITAIYERGSFSSRLAFNKRDEAVFSFTETRPDFIGGSSQLDLQLGWTINKHLNVQFLASNLIPEDSATIEYSQVGVSALNSYALSERRFSIGIRAKF